MEFSLRSNEILQYGNSINTIADSTITATLATIRNVADSINFSSFNVKGPIDSLTTDLNKHLKNVRLLGSSMRLIAARFAQAESNIIQGAVLPTALGAGAGAEARTAGSSRTAAGNIIDPDMWKELKLLAEILGLSAFETISYILDVAQILAAAGIEGISGLFTGYDWEQWLYEYVPNHVNDSTLLAILTVLSSQGIDDATRAEHYAFNVEGWENYQAAHPGDAYIEHQGIIRDSNGKIIDYGMSQDIIYGDRNGDYNACEVIATYNALLALNGGESPVSFPELLETFEESGIVLNGEFGTNPTALYLYLEASGYDANMLCGMSVTDSALNNMQSEYSTYILTAYNDANNLGAMIHTISITCETDPTSGDSYYVIHNAGDSTHYDSLADAVNGYNGGNGEPITVIGVSK